MRRLLTLGLAVLALVCVAPTAHADVMTLPGGPRLSDCAKARDPARCEARLKAREACRDKRGDTKRMCMDAYIVSPDCARADQPKRCIAQKNAELACAGKQGKIHKACMQSELRTKYRPAANQPPVKPAG